MNTFARYKQELWASSLIEGSSKWTTWSFGNFHPFTLFLLDSFVPQILPPDRRSRRLFNRRAALWKSTRRRLLINLCMKQFSGEDIAAIDGSKSDRFMRSPTVSAGIHHNSRYFVSGTRKINFRCVNRTAVCRRTSLQIGRVLRARDFSIIELDEQILSPLKIHNSNRYVQCSNSSLRPILFYFTMRRATRAKVYRKNIE